MTSLKLTVVKTKSVNIFSLLTAYQYALLLLGILTFVGFAMTQPFIKSQVKFALSLPN